MESTASISAQPQPGDGAYLVLQQQQRQRQRQRGGGRRGGGGVAAAAGQGNESYHMHQSQQQQQNGMIDGAMDASSGRLRANGAATGGGRGGGGGARGNAGGGGGGPGRNHPGRQAAFAAAADANGEATSAAGAGLPNSGRGNGGRGRNTRQQDRSGAGGAASLDASSPAFVPGGHQGETSRNGAHVNNNSQGSQDPLPRDVSVEARPPRNRNRGNKSKAVAASRANGGGASTTDGDTQSQQQPLGKPRQSRRAAAFQGKLTTSESSSAAGGIDSDLHYHPHGLADDAMERAATGHIGRGKRSRGAVLGAYGDDEVEGEMEKEKDDLASKLMRGLSRRPFLECPICFSPLTPGQAIWSCSPTTSLDASPASSCCYTPFHLSCIKDWSERSLEEAREKARERAANSESRGQVSWRCPGCQKHRERAVGGYSCFCGAVKNLKSSGGNKGGGGGGGGAVDPNLFGLPHSCGQGCSRRRVNCSHPCPLSCHPGPCPPCGVQLVVPCPSHESPLTVKCSMAHGSGVDGPPCCEQVCDLPKRCGNPRHRCAAICHEAPCDECTEGEVVKCFCGREEKDVACGWQRQQEVECKNEGGEVWMGRYGCGRECERLYDCGVHSCEQRCHPHPASPLVCPSSPDIVTHCACGQTQLHDLPIPRRTACTDPIPTCGKRCPQPQSGCDHSCSLECHTGPCPPCTVQVVVPCRCGESKITMECWKRKESARENGDSAVVLCDRVCHALRVCGRHECGRQCCPLAYRAKSKAKRRDISEVDDDPMGLHTCQLVCGKLLPCGLHNCPSLDHRGPCGRCLEASYEELVCRCGRTVVQPPIACGTVIDCTYPCSLPPPPCGHPKTPHVCHEDDDCPACPYLTSKSCACGKNPAVKNVRCSQEKVTCGQICGSLLDCGFHSCEKSCHPPGEHEECHQMCRKPKKLCKHPHLELCHAPSACSEDEPCSTSVLQTCPCGHLQQRATCGACTSNPYSKEAVQLKCIPECQQRQRNARLAEALGIKKPTQQPIEYPPDLKVFAHNNHSFVLTVEKTFADFFMSPKQALVLPHTPPAKRQVVVQLAEYYRFATELVDAEPNRSVQIRRRVDSRIPSPLLSASVAAATQKRQLGGLGDLKSGVSMAAPVARSAWSAPKGLQARAGAATPTSARPSPVPSPKPPRAGPELPLTDPEADDWDKSDGETG